MKKQIFGAAALVVLALLSSCAVPLSGTTGPKSATPGKATVTFSIKNNGFSYVASGAVSEGRFTIPPSATFGNWVVQLTDPDNAGHVVTGSLEDGVPEVVPGLWDIDLELQNAAGESLGVASLPGYLLQAGPNIVPVTITPNQGGAGTIDVTYDWTGALIDNGSVQLFKLTVSGMSSSFGSSRAAKGPTITETPVTVDSGDFTWFGTGARFIKTVPSGSYKLILFPTYQGKSHPPISATAVVYDNVTSVVNPYYVTTGQLNGPPEQAVSNLAMSLALGGAYLTWDVSPTTATGYRVYRNGSAITPDLGAFATSTVDMDFVHGSTTYYEVRPFNGFGEGPPMPTHFVSASSVTLTMPFLHMGVTTDQQATAVVAPSNVTSSLVGWTSSNSSAASVDPDGLLVGLNMGTTTVSASSYESGGYADSKVVVVESVVSTVAGTPDVSGSADGIPGTFSQPSAVGYDAKTGDLFVIDNSQTIRRIAPDGTVTTGLVTGSIGHSASAIIVDGSGNLYFTAGQAVFKATWMNPDEYSVSLLAGDPLDYEDVNDYGFDARFHNPSGLALSPDGAYLYIADYDNNKIKKYDTSTYYVSTFAGIGAVGDNGGTLATAQFDHPRGIAVDSNGYVYVACAEGRTVRRIDSVNDTVTTIAGAYNAAGTLDGSGTAARLFYPMALAVDGNYLYLADYDRVRRLEIPMDPNDPVYVRTVALPNGTSNQDGLALTEAGFSFASLLGIAVGNGQVFVGNTYSHTIRRIQTSRFASIQSNESRFNDAGVMQYNFSNYLPAGDGSTGLVTPGSILLYTTDQSNHGKLVVTGIDLDTVTNPGTWTVHLSWVTWDVGGTVVSQGSNLSYQSQDVSGYYIDLDTGGLVASSGSGDLFLSGNSNSYRWFTPASNAVTAGVYR